MSGPDGDEDLLALSIVEPDSFTAARNARAKELRAAKEKDRAAVVAKLPKPTWTSWALNVLARDQPGEVGAWLAAGDALDAALNGAQAGDREAVREAQQGERAALGRAVDRVGAILTGAGRKADDQAVQRVTGTLRAAVTDPAVRGRLVRGVLAEDIEAPSFGFGFAAPVADNVVSMASARSSRAAKKKGSAAAKKAASGGRSRSAASARASAQDPDDAEEQARLEQEEAEAREAEERAEARRIAEEEHAAEVARLQADVEARQADLERLTAVAEEAEAAARSARDDADAADRALADARAALADLPPVDHDAT